MDIYHLLHPLLYHKVYIISLFCISVMISAIYVRSTDSSRVLGDNSSTSLVAGTLFTLLVSAFIGLRPVSPAFIDMKMYAYNYNTFIGREGSEFTDSRGEWMFYELGKFCKSLGLIDQEYFLVVATLYFGLMAVCCWRLMRNNMLVAVIFCFVSFSCFSYGTNGIRNGLACSVAMLAVTLLAGAKWERIVALVLMFVAVNIHRSTALPSACALAALYLVKDTKAAIYFWVASIFISLVAGSAVTSIFVALGFDDRMEQYANLDAGDTPIDPLTSQLSGFRIDFIIYSIMPIVLAWYVTVKRNFRDKTYHILSTTYILANAFWVMVIRSEQSNRFAYLSWFLYPLVIAYPLLRMKIWDDQDRKAALILLAYAGFTFFMDFVYYG